MNIISYEKQADSEKYMYIMHWDSMKDSNYRFHNTHVHKAIELVICEEGEMCFKGSNFASSITSQQVLIFNSFDKHYYEYVNEFKGYILVLSIDFITDILTSPVLEFQNVISLTNEDWIEFSQLLERLYKLDENASFFKKKAKVLLLFDVLNKYDLIRNKNEVTLKELSTQIFEYIETHYSENLTLKSVARTFGYSTSYFSALFSKILGNDLTFVSYLNQLRAKKLDELKKMPIYSKEPMKSLIKMCGFTSSETYYRTVRKSSKSI